MILKYYTVDTHKLFFSKKKYRILDLSSSLGEGLKQITLKEYDYLDITNFYKTKRLHNALDIEKLLIDIKGKIDIIINKEAVKDFWNDFGIHFEKKERLIQIDEKAENIELFDLNQKKINNLEEYLNNNLYGHKVLKGEFIQNLKAYQIMHKIKNKKIISLLFMGKSGVGKTEFAKLLHKYFYNNEKIIKINMGNYTSQGSLNSLIGSPKGYIGSEQGGELSNKIKKSNSKIIIIDEFEKADEKIFNFFYELLEDGQFTDLDEQEFDLDGYILIFTTNLEKDNFKSVLKPPLLSRFDKKFYFDYLHIDDKISFINNYIDSLVINYNSIYKKKYEVEKFKITINFRTILGEQNLREIIRLIDNEFIEFLNL